MTDLTVNPETIFIEPDGKLTWAGRNALQQIADASGGSGGNAGAEIIDGWFGLVEVVQDKDYTLVLNVPFAGTITATTTQSETGTATFTFKVNSTAFSGTANDVSTVEQTQTHSTTFVAGDNIVLTASANSSCEGAAFTIKYERS